MNKKYSKYEKESFLGEILDMQNFTKILFL